MHVKLLDTSVRVDSSILNAVMSKLFVTDLTVQVYEIDLEDQNWA